MPVITLYKERFSKFMGKKVTIEELTKNLPWIGFDLEEITEDYVKAEYNPNRIDFCSYAGVARALKGFLELETGMPKYTLNAPKTTLVIDKAVANVRPYMLAGVVRNIKLDEDAVVELMEIQEDLHWGIGRDRKKASIGIHNLDVVKPPLTFTAVEPKSVKFVPLGKTEEMDLKEILEKHEKGMDYRHLVDWSSTYPLLIDKDGAVLSMPPIINGELTRVDANTRNLFLDVTGTSYEAVEKSLNILATALADMGGTLEKVNVKYSDRTVVSPNLDAEKMKLRVDYANELLGLKLSEAETIRCLRKCRLDAKRMSKGVLEVYYPAYRIDILHEVDLVEEVAIGYGYYKLKPTIPKAVTVGEQHPAHRLANTARQIMIGLGFLEAMNFTLTNERIHYEYMRTKPENPIKLANPVSMDYTIMRQSLLPGLIKNLADNKSESFPQRLFEASDVGKINKRTETMCERRLHVAAVSSHSTANFTEIKSIVEAFLANLELKWQIKEAKHPSFLEGRTAAIIINGKQLGVLGEIHPQVLNNFELENPTAAFEIDLEPLIKKMKHSL
ncbi:MAG: phenylalanine--tRNA ligase subunit beta [Candidatus Bathyarchaeota archaeon]|jgi:phenylalanyl-tRNA synthetase beta chain|nr:phenylalanine--tRNA ligase subunit beta [Candidatus Bathyarchaeota archaeon A05DMB-5]MDH7557775.1 phenylalanine--tRNA ligase subunit beta [Candidatus Bathyarchaeota archaeon]